MCVCGVCAYQHTHKSRNGRTLAHAPKHTYMCACTHTRTHTHTHPHNIHIHMHAHKPPRFSLASTCFYPSPYKTVMRITRGVTWTLNTFTETSSLVWKQRRKHIACSVLNTVLITSVNADKLESCALSINQFTVNSFAPLEMYNFNDKELLCT